MAQNSIKLCLLLLPANDFLHGTQCVNLSYKPKMEISVITKKKTAITKKSIT